MKRLFRPYSLLFYFFVIFAFFFGGVYYAIIMGVAEGQGLAAGAIVLGYGVASAFFALLFSFIIAYHAKRKVVIQINQILTIIILIFLAVTAYKIITREQSPGASDSLSKIYSQNPRQPVSAPALDILLPITNSEFGIYSI